MYISIYGLELKHIYIYILFYFMDDFYLNNIDNNNNTLMSLL